uniref:Uncharacterized protein n=1 Tax=Romanomermis culicivorax TaxID=13658 RepID=A0A915HKQ3_ROMCU
MDERQPQCSCVDLLLIRISKLRKKEMAIDTEDFTIVLPTDKHAWAKIFVEYFLSNVHCSLPRCLYQSSDDMLWYVQASGAYSYASISRNTSVLDVYRRQSKKQPTPGAKHISWEETVYLNLILHHIEYSLTCAVCTKTSPHNLQILKKNTQRVYASPSRRRMDIHKGEAEEISYPHIYFCVDNFERVFSDIVVRDGECVCVELSAKDRNSRYESVIFLGSIRYEVLRQVYETKGSSAWQWASKWMSSSSDRHLEFVRMKGPRGKGFAEMAVSKLNDPSPTPSRKDSIMSVSAYAGDPLSIVDAAPSDDQAARAAVDEYQLRRASDTNLAAKSNLYYSTNYRWRVSPVKKSQSEADTSHLYPEVEANSIDDEFEESSLARLWNVRGFGQAWHWLREKKRATCVPLCALLTYITLPWASIVEDLFDNSNRPILNFDFGVD